MVVQESRRAREGRSTKPAGFVGASLYIVAPESRLDKVRRELKRPTFQTLDLHTMCGFFAFETLIDEAPGILRWASDPTAIGKLAQKVDSRQ